MKPGPIVLVATGTGGHIFPAWAVGRVLLSENHKIFWITDTRGASYGGNVPSFQETLSLRIGPFQGNLWKKGLALLDFGKCFLRSLFFLKKHKVQVVWGFGGYASLPPLLAAWVLGVPRGLHQADALVGKANRFLGRFCKDLATSFPVVEGIPDGVRPTYTGLPLRPEIEALTESSYPVRDPAMPFHLLVTGGSQGAALWGRVLPQAIALLTPERQRLFQILHQCRAEQLAQTQEAYAQTAATVTLTPFIQDMAEALKNAHLVIARAGASTIMELAASGRPALLVPYPFAAENHQTLNAEKVVAQKGAWMMDEKDLSPETLKEFLEKCLESTENLKQCSHAIKMFWQPGAAARLAHLIEEKLMER